MRVNVGCGTHYAKGWLNVDCVANDNTHPDLIAHGYRLPFPERSVERIYAGHVLEHVPWADVPAFLAELRRVAAGEILFTGPDLYRTIREWHAGRLSWEIVESVGEHQDRLRPDWPEAVHKWNCHETRMLDAIRAAGFHADPAPVDRDGWDGWPVVNWSAWQCAVMAA